MIAAGPATFFLGCASMGHFITLDEELPGGWSNPEGSRKIWYLSVGELLLKLAAFSVLVWGVYVR